MAATDDAGRGRTVAYGARILCRKPACFKYEGEAAAGMDAEICGLPAGPQRIIGRARSNIELGCRLALLENGLVGEGKVFNLPPSVP